MPLPPLVEPVALTPEQVQRGSRHVMLPGMGLDGLGRLANSRVLVIGAGGLGSPVLHYLSAAGVGTIGIVDFDRVDLSNLQRQVIHRTSSVGQLKTDSAAVAITAIDPSIRVVQHPIRLEAGNALDLFAGYDLVLDGSDNFATRYLANDTAVLCGIPYVWGSVLRFDGQVTVFWDAAPGGVGLDYRDLHPTPPAPGDVLSCDGAGVLGAVCGVIGSMMAAEAVKLLTGVGEPLLGRVQTLDGLTGRWRESAVRRSPSRVPVSALIDYEAFCGTGAGGTGGTGGTGGAGSSGSARPADGSDEEPTVGPHELELADLIDVREPFEREIVRIGGDRAIGLEDLLDDPHLAGDGPVVIYCKTGARSARVARALRAAGIEAVSLRGGVLGWIEEIAPTATRY